MAAELLIRLEVTPTYRKGAILAVKPEGWSWSDQEQSGPFIRVRITDADVVDLEPYLVPYLTGPEGAKELVDKRFYYMESTAVDSINAGGKFLATTFASFQNFIRNIIDDG